MLKRLTSKAVLLTAILATGATVSVQTVMAQNASSVTLELFNAKPSESSQPTASLEIGANGGDLKTIEAPDKAGKARYLRAKVSSGAGVENFVYRVIGNPNNGTLFVITPDSKVILLKKMLISTGLEVDKDKTVKLGAQTDFSSTKSAVTDTSIDASAKSTGSSTTTAATATETATDSSTTVTPTDSSTSATPADASATTPATDSSTTAPAEPSTTATTTEASTAPATTATPDASATPATPAADATAATPATDATATPASSTASTEAAALTAPVSTTVGKVELTVIPAGATAPASSEKNLILAPVADATEATSSVEGNTVTLSYTSSSSIDDVSKFYDDQLKAQGFTPDAANATNQKSADQFVKVYKRGATSMTMSVKNENGAYQVEVDLESLANGN